MEETNLKIINDMGFDIRLVFKNGSTNGNTRICAGKSADVTRNIFDTLCIHSNIGSAILEFEYKEMTGTKFGNMEIKLIPGDLMDVIMVKESR